MFVTYIKKTYRSLKNIDKQKRQYVVYCTRFCGRLHAVHLLYTATCQ
jgi:hypothetical protein